MSAVDTRAYVHPSRVGTSEPPPTVQSTTVLAWHGQVPPYLFDTWLAGIQIPPYPFTTLKIRDIE